MEEHDLQEHVERRREALCREIAANEHLVAIAHAHLERSAWGVLVLNLVLHALARTGIFPLHEIAVVALVADAGYALFSRLTLHANGVRLRAIAHLEAEIAALEGREPPSRQRLPRVSEIAVALSVAIALVIAVYWLVLIFSAATECGCDVA